MPYAPDPFRDDYVLCYKLDVRLVPCASLGGMFLTLSDRPKTMMQSFLRRNMGQMPLFFLSVQTPTHKTIC